MPDFGPFTFSISIISKTAEFDSKVNSAHVYRTQRNKLILLFCFGFFNLAPMTVTVLSVGLVLLSLFSCPTEASSRICPKNFSCTPVTDCHINFDDYVIYQCGHAKKVCCPIQENYQVNSKVSNQFELINTTNVSESIRREQWRNPVDNNENLNYEGSTVNSENRRSDLYGNQEFLRNATLSASISDRPILNSYPHPNVLRVSSTSSPINSNNFEPVRLNIPDYNSHVTPKNPNNFGEIPNRENNHSVIRRPRPFKENCGLTFADNKVTGGKVAEIGQFPWMALLAFRQSAQPNPQFLCGGTLITTKHVLTAAHCMVENKPLELIFVRLGEYNLTSQRDCVNVGNDRMICADQHSDVPVEQVVVHPEYNRRTLKNDIAVIRLRYEVRESDYIRTICLPFDKSWSYSDLTDQNFTVSGWGKTQSGNLFGSDILQYAKVTTWDQNKCNKSIPAQVKPLSDAQLCANGHNTEDACKGDSGGPLMNITLDKNLEVRHIQFGIVSFGTATCGDKNLPTIYTRVDTYLRWIVEIVTRMID